ncbi:MAG TPA: hypothetical protein VLF61_02190 [Rhabdochlamydiaceae bacterium]|nr:hypothetical protein [Rhabdochlamydiaceae bacterium]
MGNLSDSVTSSRASSPSQMLTLPERPGSLESAVFFKKVPQEVAVQNSTFNGRYAIVVGVSAAIIYFPVVKLILAAIIGATLMLSPVGLGLLASGAALFILATVIYLCKTRSKAALKTTAILVLLIPITPLFILLFLLSQAVPLHEIIKQKKEISDNQSELTSVDGISEISDRELQQLEVASHQSDESIPDFDTRDSIEENTESPDSPLPGSEEERELVRELLSGLN